MRALLTRCFKRPKVVPKGLERAISEKRIVAKESFHLEHTESDLIRIAKSKSFEVREMMMMMMISAMLSIHFILL